MTDIFAGPEGATPLDDEDQQGLRRSDIAFRHELNAAEADNIGAAMNWAFSRRRTLPALLTQAAVKDLHRRMFGDVWSWAGTFRTPYWEYREGRARPRTFRTQHDHLIITDHLIIA